MGVKSHATQEPQRTHCCCAEGRNGLQHVTDHGSGGAVPGVNNLFLDAPLAIHLNAGIHITAHGADEFPVALGIPLDGISIHTIATRNLAHGLTHWYAVHNIYQDVGVNGRGTHSGYFPLFSLGVHASLVAVHIKETMP